jgi:putative ABC transport system ATP-binding protein
MTMILQATDLSKSYGHGRSCRRALRGTTLGVASGEWVAVVGPSGCGKSTLLHLLGGLDVPDAGTVTLGDDDLTRMSAGRRAVLRRRRVGLVFQAYNLIPYLDVTGNVELVCRIAGQGRREARARARELLDMLGLGELSRARPVTLSGGQQQRVAVARALAARPEVLLADEPTGALDSESAGVLVGLLRAEHGRGQTIVMVTHDYSLAAEADRVIFLRDGVVVDERRPGGSGRATAPEGVPDGWSGAEPTRPPDADWADWADGGRPGRMGRTGSEPGAVAGLLGLGGW